MTLSNNEGKRIRSRYMACYLRQRKQDAQSRGFKKFNRPTKVECQRGIQSLWSVFCGQRKTTAYGRPGFSVLRYSRVLVDGLDHVLDDLLRVAEDHHGLVEVEQLVVQAGITA